MQCIEAMIDVIFHWRYENRKAVATGGEWRSAFGVVLCSRIPSQDDALPA